MKKYRTIGRVLTVSENDFNLLAIGWSASKIISLSKQVLPKALAENLCVDQRLIFWCNLQAQHPEAKKLMICPADLTEAKRTYSACKFLSVNTSNNFRPTNPVAPTIAIFI